MTTNVLKINLGDLDPPFSEGSEGGELGNSIQTEIHVEETLPMPEPVPESQEQQPVNFRDHICPMCGLPKFSMIFVEKCMCI